MKIHFYVAVEEIKKYTLIVKYILQLSIKRDFHLSLVQQAVCSVTRASWAGSLILECLNHKLFGLYYLFVCVVFHIIIYIFTYTNLN